MQQGKKSDPVTRSKCLPKLSPKHESSGSAKFFQVPVPYKFYCLINCINILQYQGDKQKLLAASIIQFNHYNQGSN